MLKKIFLVISIFSMSHSEAFRLFDQPVNIGDRVKPDASTVLQLSSTDKGFVVPRMTEAQRDAITTPITGLEIYNTTANRKQIFNGTQWVNVGDGRTFFKVTQTGHGRPIGCPHTPVYFDGTIWTDARADAQLTLGTHVIVEVVNADIFIVAQAGIYDCAGHGLLPNTHYFVSDTVAGGLVTIEPEVYSNPIIYVEDAGTIHVMNLRASANTGNVRTGAVDSVFGRNGDVIAQPGDYSASQINFTPAGDIISADVQAAIQELDLEKVPAGAIINALASFDSDGLLTQTSTGNFTSREITAASAKVSITNGNGVAGNPSIDIVEANIDHDLLLNFEANEHIDWTNSTANFITTGTLSSGPATVTGDIAVTGLVDGRDLQADGLKLDGIEAGADVTDATNVAAAGAVMDFDFLSNGLMVRTAAGSYTNRTIISTSPILGLTNGDGVAANPTFSFDETLINIQNLLNFNANSFIDHSSVIIDVSDPNDGIEGGGDITATRTLRMDINSLVDAVPVDVDEFIFYDLSTNELRKVSALVLATALDSTVYGELPVVTGGSAILPALSGAPVRNGTERVYLNGVRMTAGAANDYTINNASGVITFNFVLLATDRVLVDYDRG